MSSDEVKPSHNHREENHKDDSPRGHRDGKPRGSRFGRKNWNNRNRDFGRRRQRQYSNQENVSHEANGDGPEENGSSSDPEVTAEVPLDSSLFLSREAKDAISAIARASGVRITIPRRDNRRSTAKDIPVDGDGLANDNPSESVIKIVGKVNQEKINSVQATVKSLLTHVASPPSKGLIRGRGRRDNRDGKDWFEFTHFLSIPLNIPTVQEKLKGFKADVLKEFPETHEDVFQVPDKIHLTMGMLSLTDDDKKTKAKELLLGLKDALKDKCCSNPVKFDIKGLGCFGEPKRTRVVFGKVAGSGQEDIKAVSSLLSDKFSAEGLLQKEGKDSDETRLHITVMNQVFRERIARRGSKNWRDRPRIPRFLDASEILQKFEDLSLASDVELKELHISSLRDFGDDGFYQSLEVLKLD